MADYDPLGSDADPFRPPAIPTLVGCLHCGQEYESFLIEWRVETDKDGQRHGFWCCPVEGCGGRGFGFDILPLDPDYQDEHGGWIRDGEEEDDDEEDDWLDEGEDADPLLDGEEPGKKSEEDGEENIPF